MAIAIYVKEFPKLPKEKKPRVRNKKADKIFFALISFIGVSSIIFAAWPFLVWQLSTIPKLTAHVENPIPKERVLSATTTAAGQSVQVVQDTDGFSYFTTVYKPTTTRPKEFTISIPKLKIDTAIVKVDSVKFDQNLALFPGSAIPGDIGNAFITGHSVLPQFFNAKDYKTIFSKLPDLEIGDEINVEIDGKKYQYLVQYKKVVDPKDTSVLLPISSLSRNLTLMTCVPPGSSFKRMVVITSLI